MPYWARKLPAVDSIYLTFWKRQDLGAERKELSWWKGTRRADSGLIRMDLSKPLELHRAKNSDRTACELRIKNNSILKNALASQLVHAERCHKGGEAEAGGTVGVLKVLPTFVTLDVGLPALPTAPAAGHTRTYTHALPAGKARARARPRLRPQDEQK